MAANTNIVVTGMDFNTIRSNLRDFISAKPEFKDYDFNDSAIGTLLDLLAYNTYYNAFLANMTAAEAHIGSAQLLDSVVSRAKLVGYRPRAARGAQANALISFTATANSTFRTITVPRNSRFTSVMNGASLTFVTPSSYSIAANS